MKTGLKKSTLLVILCAVGLAGCATPYQKGGRFGYQETRLKENVFSVSFQGNAKCEPQDVQDYALLRCAELCIQNGYKYFTLDSGVAGAKTGFYNTEELATGRGTMHRMGPMTYGHSHSYGLSGFAVPVYFPNYSAKISCFRDKPVNDSYEAEFVGRSVAEKHGYTFTDGKVSRPDK